MKAQVKELVGVALLALSDGCGGNFGYGQVPSQKSGHCVYLDRSGDGMRFGMHLNPVLQVAVGKANWTQNPQGRVKQASRNRNGYAQTGTAQTFTFPTAFSATPVLLESGGSRGTYNPTATGTTLSLPANAFMTAETCKVGLFGQ